jgi:uncharacterized protein (TIGR01732 family)
MGTNCNFSGYYRTREPYKGSTFVLIVILFILLIIVGSRLEKEEKQMHDSFFKKIEQKTGVSMDEVFTLANAIQYADFSDEKQVKKIVRKVSKIANKPISKELEEKIVKSVVEKGNKLNLNEIANMMNQKNE